MRADFPMLNAVLERSDELDDVTTRAFTEWRDRLRQSPRTTLSAKQRSWLKAVARKLDIPEPAFNEWSSRSPAEREAIRGAEVQRPEVLRRLPLKPPGMGGGVKVL